MTLQEDLRKRLRKTLGLTACPTCGHPTGNGSMRQGAAAVKIPLPSLHRFLSGGNADGKTLDAIHAYLCRKGEDRE